MDDGDAYAGLSPRSRRKRKNRDQMRAARQREKETMERLHAMVERLETQFRKLQDQNKHDETIQVTVTTTTPMSAAAVIANGTSGARVARVTPAVYAEALSLKAQYQEENFHLKQTLYEKNKLKETLERHVGDFVEPTLEERDVLMQDFPDETTSESVEPVMAQAKIEDDPTSAYSFISESTVWAIIADIHARMSTVQQSLAVAATTTSQNGTPQSRMTVTVLSSPAAKASESSDDELAGSTTPSSTCSSPASPPISSAQAPPPFLGWDIRHELVHNQVRFFFEKSFPHVTAFDAMVRMWDNERSMISSRHESYRDVPTDGRQSFGLVQQLNDDTYIFQRRLADASTGHREIVSTYLRYRLRTHDGFLSGSASIDDMLAVNSHESSVRNRAWASQLCLWTEFVPILNNTGCRVRMTGTMNLDNPAALQRNLANVVIGLLRWENLHIGPVFALADR